LPPATSYKENVARAAAFLSPAQLEQMKAKFSNLRQALADAETTA
jgi:DNA-binding GntR family transcriptional regulator